MVFIFILLIAAAGDICIRILNSTSGLIVVEFNELKALQDVQVAAAAVSLPHLQNIGVKDTGWINRYKRAQENLRRKIIDCRSILSSRHTHSDLDRIEQIINMINRDGLIEKYQYGNPADWNSDMADSLILYHGIIDKTLNNLIRETNDELNHYIQINETAVFHSKLTIAILTVILIFTLIVGGIIFIRRLTMPLTVMMDAIGHVSKGNFMARVEVSSKDEFQVLAETFNRMIDQLDHITVSRNFYNNVINNMSNGLVVCDTNLRVTAINRGALLLLALPDADYLHMKLERLFARADDFYAITALGDSMTGTASSEMTITTMANHQLPCLVVRSLMLDDQGTPSGSVIIMHDLTEKRKIEAALETVKKERDMALYEAAEKERIRVSRDLHDGLGQILTSVSYSIQNLFSEKEYPVSSAQSVILADLRNEVAMAIAETKRIARDLIPLELADFGLVPAIARLTLNMNTAGTTDFRLNHFGLAERFDPRVEKILYRVCQEAFNNIVKHADASTADVQLIRHEDSLVLTIEDNGKGFYMEESGQNGIGITSIRERVATLNGTTHIHSEPGNGTEIIIEIPCRKNHEQK